MSGRRRAVFVDRDGTLIVDRHYLADPAGVELLPGVARGLARLAAAGLALVVTTNQSGVARGFFAEDAVLAVNRRLAEVLESAGVALAGIYYCPHLPDGAVARYAVACECRKPKLGMFRRAAAEHELELAGSFAVGDRAADVERVSEVGATGLLIGPGPPPAPGVEVVASFEDAVARILRG